MPKKPLDTLTESMFYVLMALYHAPMCGIDTVSYTHLDITVNCEELDDQILIKTDGMPTYNFANVVDDHTMGITHVIRGNEYLSSAPKYNLLYQAFGWDVPTYIHCSPVMRDQHNKMSKRHGDPSYEDLLSMGFLSEAEMCIRDRPKGIPASSPGCSIR